MRLSLRQFLFDSSSDDQSFGDVFKRRLVQKEVVVLKHETVTENLTISTQL